MRKSYALAASLQGNVEHNGETSPKFRGASTVLADGSTFDIGAALEANGGVIVTEEPELQMLFDEHPALVQNRGDVPKDASPVTSYASRTKEQLLALPAAATIQGGSGMTKDELTQRLAVADSGGDPNAELPGAGKATGTPAPAAPKTGGEKTRAEKAAANQGQEG